MDWAMWDPISQAHSMVRTDEVPVFSPPIVLAMDLLQRQPIVLDTALVADVAMVAEAALGVDAQEDDVHADDWGSVIGRGLRSVQFHSTLSGELLVCLVYHDERLRHLRRNEQLPGADEDRERWLQAARTLRERFLEAGVAASVDVIGRWKRRRLCQERDFVVEVIGLENGQRISLRQPEGQFSNPNADCEVHCLNWLCREVQRIQDHSRSKLIEMHCGAGTNTVALAPFFEEVIAVEINRVLADAAKENLSANGIQNVRLVRAAGADAVKASQDSGELSAAVAPALLVDPPRAGLDPLTRQWAAGFEHILYISCNPDALAEDLRLLSSHETVSFAVFDMFPYTSHAECAVHLQRRTEVPAGCKSGSRCLAVV